MLLAAYYSFNCQTVFKGKSKEKMSKRVKKYPTSQVCRICMKNCRLITKHPDNEKLSIFIFNVIKHHFWFQVDPKSKKLPSGVCQDCWTKVKAFHEFYNEIYDIHVLNEMPVPMPAILASTDKKPELCMVRRHVSSQTDFGNCVTVADFKKESETSLELFQKQIWAEIKHLNESQAKANREVIADRVALTNKMCQLETYIDFKPEKLKESLLLDLLPPLPCNSEDELVAFEASLENLEVVEQLKKRFLLFTNSDYKIFLETNLTLFFSSNMWPIHYSFHGHLSHNKSIKDLKMFQILLDVTKKMYKCTEFEIIYFSKRFFRKFIVRCYNNNKRKMDKKRHIISATKSVDEKLELTTVNNIDEEQREEAEEGTSEEYYFMETATTS